MSKPTGRQQHKRVRETRLTADERTQLKRTVARVGWNRSCRVARVAEDGLQRAMDGGPLAGATAERLRAFMADNLAEARVP